LDSVKNLADARFVEFDLGKRLAAHAVRQG
jgi:hypothetical protein